MPMENWAKYVKGQISEETEKLVKLLREWRQNTVTLYLLELQKLEIKWYKYWRHVGIEVYIVYIYT